ncbi:MAG: hypothetical protein VW450_07900 [Chloroflexota bacterium]
MAGGRAQAEETLAALGPLRQLAAEVRAYPLRLLEQVCAQADARGGTVPDHLLRLDPYLGDAALRALVEGGYIAREAGERAIYVYAPTAQGRALVEQARAR